MAIVRKNKTVAMLLSLENGVNAAGKTIYKTITFGKINPELTDDEFFSAAGILVELQSLPLHDVKHRKIEVLVSE